MQRMPHNVSRLPAFAEGAALAFSKRRDRRGRTRSPFSVQPRLRSERSSAKGHEAKPSVRHARCYPQWCFHQVDPPRTRPPVHRVMG